MTCSKEFLLDELEKIQLESNKISKEILDFIKVRQKRLFQLVINEQELNSEFFKLDINYELPNFNDQAWNDLYDLCDGQVQGWNLNTDYVKQIANSD